MSFSQILNQDLEQSKLLRGRKFSEIKVQKPPVLGETYCARKCKKVDIENFIVVAL